ncbi:MAG: hypothetical protein RIS47_2117 [Bacteroidota bacterium]|jgi:mannose-6-phosphate isomerase-like protein (cupin superfamily)
MKHTNYLEAEAKQNPHGADVKMLYNQDSAQAVHISLEPGQGLKPHITPVDVFFYILEGNPTILVGTETYVAQVNDLVESPKDIVHNITNHGDTKARILVVKAPRPAAAGLIL